MSEYLAFCRFNLFRSHLFLEKQGSFPGSAVFCQGLGGPREEVVPECPHFWHKHPESSEHISPLAVVCKAKEALGRTCVLILPKQV